MGWQADVRNLEKKHKEFIDASEPLKMRGHIKKGWSLNDSAKELGISTGKMSESIRLAKGLKRYPEMLRIQERRDAIAFLKIKGEW